MPIREPISAPIVVRAASAPGFDARDFSIPTGQCTLVCGPEAAPHLSIIKASILDESSRRLRAALDLRQGDYSAAASKASFDSVEGLQPSIDIRTYLEQAQNDSQKAKFESTIASLIGLDEALTQFLKDNARLSCAESECALEDAEPQRVAARIMSEAGDVAADTNFALVARRKAESAAEVDGFLSAAISAGVRRILRGEKIERLETEEQSKESRQARAENLFKASPEIALIVDTLSKESLDEARLLESFSFATGLGAQIVSVLQLNKKKEVCREWRAMRGFLCSRCGAAVTLARGNVLGEGPDSITLRYLAPVTTAKRSATAAPATTANRSATATSTTAASPVPLSKEELLELLPGELLKALPKDIPQRLGNLLRLFAELLPLELAPSRKLSETSSGEGLLIILLSFLAKGLNKTTFFIERPSDVLHPLDLPRLSSLIKQVCEQGNTVIILDSSAHFYRDADWLLNFEEEDELSRYRLGYCGAMKDFKVIREEDSLLSETDCSSLVEHPGTSANNRIATSSSFSVPEYVVEDGTGSGLEIAFSQITAVSGRVGSGKTSLLRDIVAARGKNKSRGAKTFFLEESSAQSRRVGAKGKRSETIVERLDCAPSLAKVFAQQAQARKLGLDEDSFLLSNSETQCAACKGRGVLRVELDFVGVMEEECEHCSGARFSPKPLEVLYKGLSIADVLSLTIYEASAVFADNVLLAPLFARYVSLGLGELLLSSDAKMLSRFQEKRVSLAVLLARECRGGDVLCLDQTLSGAPKEVLSYVMIELRRQCENGAAVVLSGHEKLLLSACDRIIDMKRQKKFRNLK
jgi:excinuclease UvrABC ATPase subunit